MSDWTREDVLGKIPIINPWKNSKTGERAPHTPLLILSTLGSEQREWCAELHRLRGVFLAATDADETQSVR